jgi:transcriptional regulator with XRE-family HTH domain
MSITLSTKVLKAMHPRNQEFLGMAKLCGWSQAEIARQLHLTRGAVSQIFHGKTHPHPRTLYLFEMILAKEENTGLNRVERTPGLDGWESEVVAWMRRMHQAQQQRFAEALRLLVKAYESGRQQVIWNIFTPETSLTGC